MNILITGEGGQGVQTIAKILAASAYEQGLHTTYLPHYGVEMRMGISRAYVCISGENIYNPKFFTAEMITLMTKRSLNELKQFIDNSTIIINALQLESFTEKNNLPASTYNMLVLGILVKELNLHNIPLDKNLVIKSITEILAHKGDLSENKRAFNFGLDLSEELYTSDYLKTKNNPLLEINDQDETKSHIKYPDLCKGCGLCLIKCPFQALSWNTKKKNFISKYVPKVDLKKCTACRICEQICPDCAIKVIKKL